SLTEQCVDAGCLCAPVSCALLGKDCGAVPNGCGAVQSCGSCTGLLVCGGGASANLCGVGSVCTNDRWCWDNPAPTGSRLHDADGLSPNDVWAVGDKGTALHFGGLR